MYFSLRKINFNLCKINFNLCKINFNYVKFIQLYKLEMFDYVCI